MNYASLSLDDIDLLIATDEALLEILARETDHVSPPMAAAYKRIEQLEAEKRHRKGSGFGRTNRER